VHQVGEVMTAYALRRLIQAIPTLLGATVLGFALIHLAPGDPIQFYAAQSGGMTSDDIERLRHLYGLDLPLPVQYFNWLSQLARLDLGVSFGSHQPVLQSIVARIPATLTLTVTALTMSTILGVAIGVFAGLQRGGPFDSITRLLAVIGHAVPTFWFGLVFILLFAVTWRIFPSGNIASLGAAEFDPLDRLWHLFPPALVLSLGGLATISRFARTQTLEVINQDYVRTARAKGLAEHAVTLRHVLRNCLIPVVTILGGHLPNLFGGSVVIESVFSWPGIGRMAVDAAFSRDYPVLMGLLLMLATLVALGNLLTDLAYGVIDPRIKLS
jgi:peptide/nickel transport system permease protein